MSAMKMNGTASLLPSRNQMVKAFTAKDTSYDGVFFVAVRTTGIFCRPSCPSRPLADNIEFFASIQECVTAGYRPCKRCRPLETDGTAPEWVAELMERVETAPDAPLKSAELRTMGVTPERARRWFKQQYGISFAAWCRNHRLATAFSRLHKGASLDDATFESGFESHSGFREAFVRTFGETPGRTRSNGKCVVTALIESPVGPLLAGATDEGICLLEFADRRMLQRQAQTVRKLFDCAVLPGSHPLLDQLRKELTDYFDGKRRQFTVPLIIRGTPFQEKVWKELCRIPPGETISYDQLARRIAQPTAQRAVARANGMNRISILIPCHRVIGKDGKLVGYGGGLWRKRLLLELERTKGADPGAV